MQCRVFNCGSRRSKGSKVSFFSFPEDDATAFRWVEFCRQEKPFNLNTSAICMKHFTFNDFMGFTKRPLLRRGAVPTIYECDIPAAVSRPQDDSIEDLLYSCEVVLSEADKEYRPEDGTVDAPTSQIRCFYYDTNFQQEEVLKTEVETLKRENALLKKENHKQSIELASLKRESNQQLKRNSSELEALQKRLAEMAAEIKNVEHTLAGTFTKRQITKMKVGTKRRKMTQKDIAKSLALYAGSIVQNLK
ncbi:PREDICTED: THAP domain-containing protein 1-like [Rhagoletis zephyria]|uniref:THAP domain-containing protein 1-like n=1 Tax=Rhagoletis zephyria TaxID=28612 RepID=UPI0008116A21|nr:PREDICTED: THAP domain-containing protein 1-like [Rhagoletis zephyria]